MTAPVSWTPSPAASAPPPLVVRPDRGKIRSWLSLILVLNGSLAVLCLVAGMWASSTSVGAFGGGAFAITLLGCVFQMVFHSYFYGRLAGADVIAQIGPEGVRGPTSRWEHTSVPWSSIASVTKGWNAVVVQPIPGAGQKLIIPARATTSDAPTIRAAIAHFSGGRL